MSHNIKATGGQILIECLKAQGIRALFGMPGTQNNFIYDALKLHGQGIDHYLVRHEYSCTFMCDGYARACGEPAVAVTVPGPGATNASTGIVNAMNDCVPVLLLVGQSDQKLDGRHPSKVFHGMDGVKVFESITKLAAKARSASEIPPLIEQAFRIFRSGRPGPAMLEFPSDVLKQEAEVRIPEKVSISRQTPDNLDVQKAVKFLLQCNRPIIFAGAGVVAGGVTDEVQRLAEMIGSPVVVTRRAKGVLSEDHGLALSNLNGPGAAQAWNKADCLVSIGVRFTSIDTRGWTLRLPDRHLQIDSEQEEIGREYPADVGVIGDVKLALQQLIDGLQSESESRSKIAANWKSILHRIREDVARLPKPPLLTDMRELLPRDAITVLDVNSIGYRAFAEYPVYDPHTFYYPCIAVSLGSAVAAAIGAKVAQPDRKVVAFAGDGGFMMGAMELAMAKQYGINFIIIITNDDSLAAIQGSQMAACEGRYIDVELRNPDFVKFAESFGARAYRTDITGFKSTLTEALREDALTVIEVPLHDRREEIIRDIPWLAPDWLRAL